MNDNISELEHYARMDLLQAVSEAAIANEFRAPAQIALLQAIVMSVNGLLECFVSHCDLAKRTAQNERSVRTHLKELCSGGWLAYDKGCTGFSNVYQLQVGKFRQYAKYYWPKSQSEVCRYNGSSRSKRADSLEYNAKSRPYILRQGEDVSRLLSGTYFVKPNDKTVYLIRDIGDRREIVDIKALSDYDRAYASRISKDFVFGGGRTQVPPEEIPY